MTVLDGLLAAGVVTESVPLGPLTTYKMGGRARYYTEPGGPADLERLVGVGREMPVLVVGRGSNLVVADAGFPGLVIHLGPGFATIEIEGDVVTAGGASPLAQVARTAVSSGRVGLEFFVGIPGSVGGAVRQNAGCFGTETRDRLVDASVFDLEDGQTSSRTADQLDMSYRHSNLGASDLVLSARFRTVTGDVESGREEMRRITRWRKEHQPGGTLNAGSVFKNPPGATAGEIIDSLGLKGMSVGDVSVSPKHANFFVAGPNATSADIRRLVEAVKDRVLAETGTMLETEVQFVGFDD